MSYTPRDWDASVVYAISDNAGRVKIGMTVDLDRRLAHLKSKHRNSQLRVVGTIQVPVSQRTGRSQVFRIERAIHRAAAFYELGGEWFCDCPHVRYLLDMAGMAFAGGCAA